MTTKKLIVPLLDGEPTPDPDQPVTLLTVHPEQAEPGREVPGFFIIKIGNEPVWPGTGTAPVPQDSPMPRIFLSLAAVHAYLTERFGTAPPLRVTRKAKPEGHPKRDIPIVWQGKRRDGRRVVLVSALYLGDFHYWSGRVVDPCKVGMPDEFN